MYRALLTDYSPFPLWAEVMTYLPFLYHQPGHLEALYPPVWHFMGEQLPQNLRNKSC